MVWGGDRSGKWGDEAGVVVREGELIAGDT